jgi:hypothetical protein
MVEYEINRCGNCPFCIWHIYAYVCEHPIAPRAIPILIYKEDLPQRHFLCPVGKETMVFKFADRATAE